MGLKNANSDQIIRENPLKTVAYKLGRKWIYQILVDNPTSRINNMAIGKGKDFYKTAAEAEAEGWGVISLLKRGIRPVKAISPEEIAAGPVVEVAAKEPD